MNKKQPNYKFYATLLDAFHYYLKSEQENAFQEFIDKLNRVPFISEKAEKGTAFNELVDAIADNKYYELVEAGTVAQREVRKVLVYTYNHVDRQGNPWTFDFKTSVVDYFAKEYEGAIPQLRTTGYIETTSGIVELYGNLDELAGDLVADIKTTSKYDFPKYLHNYQHLVYPFTLAQEGINVSFFRYHITDFTNVFIEDYVPNPEKDEQRLRSHCEHLISFLEQHRDKITDKKLFALDDIEA